MPCLTVPCFSTRSLRCRGGGCSSLLPACRPCSHQSETEAPCPPRWCGVPCPSSAVGAGYPERPWRKELQGHRRICRRISLQPPENITEKPSVTVPAWVGEERNKHALIHRQGWRAKENIWLNNTHFHGKTSLLGEISHGSIRGNTKCCPWVIINLLHK